MKEYYFTLTVPTIIAEDEDDAYNQMMALVEEGNFQYLVETREEEGV